MRKTNKGREAMERLLKAEEVAELLNVQPSTVYEWTRTGYIPHLRLGIGKKRPCVRFKQSAIASWLQERECPGRRRRVP